MEDQTTLVRHTIRDSVFTTLFRQKIYALELYRALHPEDTTVTIDDCKIVTIERVLSTGIYNDFGLLVRNRLIFLMEAQSTFSPNMPYRMLGYLSITYKNFVDAQDGMNPFSDVAIHLPRPELYVLYTGRKKKIPDTLRLSDLYEGKGDAEIVVHVLNGNDAKGILREYVRFCEIVEQTRITLGRKREALEAILKRCMQEGVLTEFLEEHKEEVISVWTQLYDQAEVTRLTMREMELRGEKRGEKRGREQGREEGREEGIQAMVETLQNFTHSREAAAEHLVKMFHLSKDEAAKRVMQYWKA